MKVSNKEVLNRANKGRELINAVQKRKLVYAGHVIRGGGLQKILLEGMVEGKRERGRQRITWFDDVKKWTGFNYGEVRARGHDQKEMEVHSRQPLPKGRH